jgi:predicted transposase YdaD
MPELRNTRVDLLGESETGDLLHIELQSTNDEDMPMRMLEYSVRVARLFGRFPRQLVLYVGEAKPKMKTALSGPTLAFHYELMDIRTLDCEALIASSDPGDNILAVLARLDDRRDAVRRILALIATWKPAERSAGLSQLIRLAGLRKLAECVEQEAKKMPILIDIMDNPVLGREIRRGIEIGRAEGLQQGLQEGLHVGELKLLSRLVEKRFGPIPAWARKSLQKKTAADLEEIGLRILDAGTLKELLR